MPNILKYTLQISLSDGLILNRTLCFLGLDLKALSGSGKVLSFLSFFEQSTKKQFEYALQNRAWLKKHPTYYLEALKSWFDILKSSQMYEKALDKCSLYLLFSISIRLFKSISLILFLLIL